MEHHVANILPSILYILCVTRRRSRSAETYRNEYKVLKTIKSLLWSTGYFNIIYKLPQLEVYNKDYTCILWFNNTLSKERSAKRHIPISATVISTLSLLCSANHRKALVASKGDHYQHLCEQLGWMIRREYEKRYIDTKFFKRLDRSDFCP